MEVDCESTWEHSEGLKLQGWTKDSTRIEHVVCQKPKGCPQCFLDQATIYQAVVFYSPKLGIIPRPTLAGTPISAFHGQPLHIGLCVLAQDPKMLAHTAKIHPQKAQQKREGKQNARSDKEVRHSLNKSAELPRSTARKNTSDLIMQL